MQKPKQPPETKKELSLVDKKCFSKWGDRDATLLERIVNKADFYREWLRDGKWAIKGPHIYYFVGGNQHIVFASNFENGIEIGSNAADEFENTNNSVLRDLLTAVTQVDHQKLHTTVSFSLATFQSILTMRNQLRDMDGFAIVAFTKGPDAIQLNGAAMGKLRPSNNRNADEIIYVGSLHPGGCSYLLTVLFYIFAQMLHRYYITITNHAHPHEAAAICYIRSAFVNDYCLRDITHDATYYFTHATNPKPQWWGKPVLDDDDDDDDDE